MAEVEASLLAADFLNLEQEIRKAERSGADMFHLDVMDGHLVDDIAFGVQNVKTICAATTLPVDAHLMIAHPHMFAERMVAAGAKLVTIQLEPCLEIYRTIQAVKDDGAEVAVCIAPETPVACLETVVDWVDRVLLVTVALGLGGQSFIPSMEKKIERTVALREQRGLRFKIGVDGGVTPQNAQRIKQCGADYLVAGTCVLASGDMGAAVAALKA